MLRVVNLRNYKKREGEILVKIDRSSPLGNPFVMKSENERRNVCLEYREYFLNNIKVDVRMGREIQLIKDYIERGDKVALGCWCAPKECHGDFLKEYIEGGIKIEKRSYNGQN